MDVVFLALYLVPVGGSDVPSVIDIPYRGVTDKTRPGEVESPVYAEIQRVISGVSLVIILIDCRTFCDETSESRIRVIKQASEFRDTA